MFDEEHTVLNFEYGCMSFQVDVTVENEYVVGVNKVEIWCGKDKGYVEVDISDNWKFLNNFNDQLQDAYQTYLEDLEIAAAEMRMDCEKEEEALQNWEKNN